MRHAVRPTMAVIVIGAAALVVDSASAAELRIGAATADITPDRPVPLTGNTVQTFLIQLATSGPHPAYYVPSPRAVAGGSLVETPFNNYSAVATHNMIGPEGGQALVDRTVESVNELWKPAAKQD